ncbi:hypothetical protein [Actinoplanes sp. NPDC049265]|uniref:hypothetical protein n=1 Tax=Actinoplanes sp. NPDC049265 TaxID=3363902 RepID=UPI003716601B
MTADLTPTAPRLAAATTSSPAAPSVADAPASAAATTAAPIAAPSFAAVLIDLEFL